MPEDQLMTAEEPKLRENISRLVEQYCKGITWGDGKPNISANCEGADI